MFQMYYESGFAVCKYNAYFILLFYFLNHILANSIIKTSDFPFTYF